MGFLYMFKHNRRLLSLPLAGVLLAVLSGCNGQPASCLVKGTIEWNGKPVYPGTVIFKSKTGESFLGNLDAEGRFSIVTGPTGEYFCGIQVHELSGLSRLPPPRNPPSEGSSEPARREDKIPDQFKTANIDIPAKYRNAETSGLVFEITEIESDLGKIILSR